VIIGNDTVQVPSISKACQRLIDRRQGRAQIDLFDVRLDRNQCGASLAVAGITPPGGQGPAPGDEEVGPEQGFGPGKRFQQARIAVGFVEITRVQAGLDGKAIEPKVAMPNHAFSQHGFTFLKRCLAFNRIFGGPRQYSQ